MDTLRNIFRMFSFYRKKTVFFVFLILIAGVFVYSRVQSQVGADQLTGTETGNASVDNNIVVTSNGKITSNGNEVGTVQQVDNVDEVRVVLLNLPDQYLDSYVAQISLPKSVANQSESKMLAVHGVDSYNTVVVDDHTVRFEARGIGTTAEITAVVKMPLGTINFPIFTRLNTKLSDMGFSFWLVAAITLPSLAVLLLLFIIYKELLVRVDKPDKPIESPPMSLPPAIVGVIVKQKIGPREVAATLIDLSLRGDIIILDKERSFVFGKNKLEESLMGYEKILLSKIFSDAMTADKTQFDTQVNKYLYSKKISAFYYLIQTMAQRLGYLRPNYRKIKSRYSLTAIIIFLIGIGGFLHKIMMSSTEPPYSLFFWIGMIVTGVIIFALADYVPLRTKLGRGAASDWLAFKKYLSDSELIQEDDRSGDLFVRYLPYAIVLDCEAEWARRFANHNFVSPEWFVSDQSVQGLEDFCLLLFPIVSYVGQNFNSLREPGL